MAYIFLIFYNIYNQIHFLFSILSSSYVKLYYVGDILYLIMIKLRNIVLFNFARSRVRRQIQFDPKVKDLTSQQEVKLQTEQFRKKFESIPYQKFSTVLEDPHPKLEKRFFVQNKSLNKKIKQVYKQNIKMESITTHDDTDLDYLSQSKSHLLDQAKQIQFQQQFKQQLFRIKETKRLLGKKQKQVNNYLPDKQKDTKYFKYEENKKHLKNKKISNMMNMNRNNQQLELLIESGLFNDPANIKAVIEEISGKKQELLEEKKASPVKIQDKALVVKADQKQESISQRLSDIGPEHLKQRHKIVEFVQKFEDQHEKDQKSCLEDLNLLKEIKQYQQEVFLSRYEGINFRFKGRVNFGFFKENELVSYIKNENIEPKDLLLIFKQNQKAISKFKVPILTPKVISNIYSKTSLYKFPQSDHNNRLNMMNDPLFQSLERKTFKQITKLNDIDFCSVLWAYSNNHKDQQGALKIKMYEKINQAIVEEMSFRIYNLNDEDLGLAMRGMSKLHLSKYGEKCNQITNYLANRVPEVKNSYTLESIFQFLLCLPQTPQIYEIVQKNIDKFDEFKWQQKNTVLCFTNASGLILKESKNSTNSLAVKQTIKQIIIHQKQHLETVLPRISINNLPQFLTVLRQSEASLSLPKTVNLCQKLVIDNIRQQKEMIKQSSIGNILGSFALIDIQKYEDKRKSKYMKQDGSELMSVSVRKLSLRVLLPFQPIPYNSSLYLVYHELATLTYVEMQNIPNIFLAKTLDQLSIVKYKNERLHDEIAQKIFETLLTSKQKSYQLPIHQSQTTIVKTLQLLVNSYTLQKRNHPLYQQALQELLSQKYFSLLCKQSPNFLIKFITGVISVEFENNLKPQKMQKIQRILQKVIVPHIRSNIYIQEELAAIAYCMAILERYDLMNHFDLHNFKQVKNSASKFTLIFSSILSKMFKESNQKSKEECTKELREVSNMFYNQICEEIFYNEKCIGSSIGYKIVYNKIFQLLKEKYEGATLTKNNWMIEIPEHKEAYFIATYDHLMSKSQGTSQQSSKQGLFTIYGIWKLYIKFYELKGWKVKTVISFLEGK